MSTKVTLNDVESLTNQTSAVATINDNSQTIEDAFDNTLSLNGASPNQMAADIDMNSNSIINLAAPVNPNDAARLEDITTALGGLDPTLLANAATYASEAQAADADAQVQAANAAASAAAAASYVGAATSAPKWSTPRTESLTGDVAGSATVDGSADWSISTTIQAGAVGASKLASGAALSNLGYTPVNKAGDTLTGDLVLNNAESSLNTLSVGFRGIPVNEQDSTYTFVLVDSGRLVRHNSGSGHSYTIPPNSSVAYPVGTTILVRNVGAGVVTITRGAGVTQYLAGSGTSKDIALAQWGLCTLVQEAANTWVCSGVNIT